MAILPMVTAHEARQWRAPEWHFLKTQWLARLIRPAWCMSEIVWMWKWNYLVRFANIPFKVDQPRHRFFRSVPAPLPAKVIFLQYLLWVGVTSSITNKVLALFF